jgi:hypothetical protein
MKPYAVLFLAVGVFLSTSCNKNDSATDPIQGFVGTYSYVSLDSSGTTIVQGWLSLVIVDSAHISGEWHFTKVGGATGIGPQIGDGNLLGGIRSGRLWLDLNPEMRDNNLLLLGVFSTVGFSGTWQAIGEGGPYNHGSFRATRIDLGHFEIWCAT